MAAKPKTKRKDGKPDRAAKSARNKKLFKQVQPRANFVPKPHPGRPLEYTDEIAEEILSLVSRGETLKGACRQLDLCETTVRRWIVNDRGANPSADPPVAGIGLRYARARELQAEAWADDIVEIADSAIVDSAVPKLRIDTRKWLMGKNHMRRFGDKTTVQHEGGDRPIHTITSEMSLQEAADAYAASIREEE